VTVSSGALDGLPNAQAAEEALERLAPWARGRGILSRLIA